MGRLRDFLERFRPAGVPGAAARAGVPGDRAAEQRAELAGVFAALAPVEAECRAIREAAGRAACELRHRADDQAKALISDATARAEAERAKAAAAVEKRISGERAVAHADAERLAARIRDRADERLPDLITEAVRMVRKASVEGGT